MDNKRIIDYIVDNKINIDKIIEDFSDYIYKIIKNSVSVYITEEDIEEMVSDVFVAIWEKSNTVLSTTVIRPYLVGITKNIIKNKYRKSKINLNLSDYEDILQDDSDINLIVENDEKNLIIKKSLSKLKKEEYIIFIMFYYEHKSIKIISKVLKCSENKVKVTLHRIRKKIKKNLENGGYSYAK